MTDRDAPSLRELQQKMREALMSGEPENVASLLTDSDRALAYTEGYVSRLFEVLQESFPGVYRELGHIRSHEVIEAFIRANPSTSYNINTYGEKLPAFLRTHESSIDAPYLVDLAELEWLIVRSFHALAEDAIDPTSLGTMTEESWGKTRFRFQPTMFAMESEWNVLEIWNGTSKPLRRDTRVLVYRQEFEVHVTEISAVEYRMLVSLQKGALLGETIDTIGEAISENEIFQMFARWMQIGIVSAVTTS